MGRRSVFITVGCVAGLSLVVWLVVRGLGDREPPLEVVDQGNGRSADRGPDNDYVIEGGVRRRRRDIHSGGRVSDSGQSSDPIGDDEEEDFGRTGFGTIPAVAIDANLQTAAVGEILREGEDLDRLSALGRVAPFDPESYKEEPQAYLGVPVPGRAWAPAQPGEGVRQITSLGPTYQMLQQGESVSLSIVGEPGMPVTFTSLDAGEFQNKLSTITVETNDQGIAQATYSATPGVIYEVRILAASPVMAGQARWTVQVQPPNE